jgi:hypothetical protein
MLARSLKRICAIAALMVLVASLLVFGDVHASSCRLIEPTADQVNLYDSAMAQVPVRQIEKGKLGKRICSFEEKNDRYRIQLQLSVAWVEVAQFRTPIPTNIAPSRRDVPPPTVTGVPSEPQHAGLLVSGVTGVQDIAVGDRLSDDHVFKLPGKSELRLVKLPDNVPFVMRGTFEGTLSNFIASCSGVLAATRRFCRDTGGDEPGPRETRGEPGSTGSPTPPVPPPMAVPHVSTPSYSAPSFHYSPPNRAGAPPNTVSMSALFTRRTG